MFLNFSTTFEVVHIVEYSLDKYNCLSTEFVYYCHLWNCLTPAMWCLYQVECKTLATIVDDFSLMFYGIFMELFCRVLWTKKLSM